MSRRMTQEEFILKARAVHGDRYDLSHVKYVDNKTKVTVVCAEHGPWEVSPGNFLRGRGCPGCKRTTLKNLRKDSKADFVSKAVKTHGETYSYDLAEYEDSQTKLEILCPIHGSFWQMPAAHLKGHGCPHCKNRKISESLRQTSEKFIEEARRIHGERFDYSKVEYVNAHSPVTIVCKKCGEFKQTPSNHVHGEKGCKACRISKGEKYIASLLEKHGISCETQWKPDSGVFGCKLKSFDFKIKDSNTLIEFDGIQHFEPVKEFGGVQGFNLCAYRDLEKTKWAIENNYRLIRIGYHEFDQIESILSTQLAI